MQGTKYTKRRPTPTLDEYPFLFFRFNTSNLVQAINTLLTHSTTYTLHNKEVQAIQQ